MQATETATKRKVIRRLQKLMGNQFELTAVSDNELLAEEALDAGIAEIQRIEKLLTTFNEDSQTADINRNAGISPVQVDAEVFALIERSLKISRLTQGAFDISYGSVDKKLWNFDASMTALPDKDVARKSVGLINYRNIILNTQAQTVFLKEPGMRIGFGGIGKGYAADRAKLVMQKHNIKSGVVNASGDLVTWGHQPDGTPWTIGIADPDCRSKAFSSLAISNMAVATSGSYEKFAVINGKRYSHTIDPKTGLPVSGIKSASVICASAELADAMATPLMVMGIKAGLFLVNQLAGVACVLIDDNDKLYTSNNISIA